MNKVLAISRANLLRFIREPSNLFFVFIFPMLLVLVLGVSFGGTFEPRLGVVAPSGSLADAIVADLAAIDGIELVRFDMRSKAIEEVERGGLSAAVLLPDDFEAVADSGSPAQIDYLAAPGFAEDLKLTVLGALAAPANRLRAIAFTEASAGVDRATAEATVDQVASLIAPIAVTTEYDTTGPATLGGAGRFGLGAVQQVALFVFLTSLTAASQLILTRQLGVASRMMSTPTSVRAIVLGETLGRFLIALVQAMFIVLATALLFGVEWGDPLAAAVLILMYCGVSTALGIVLGSVLQNDSQAGGLGVMLGLVFAALGGAMIPLEVFSDTMQRVAHVTPHAWLIEGFEELIARNGNLADVIPQVGVLGGAAVALLGLATWLLRRSLTT